MKLAPLKHPAIEFYSLQKGLPGASEPQDTSTAHLAGALGKPVWIMNRFDSCWRWMLHREDSPWYPTLRLYRQATAGDWDGVVRRVAADLHALVS